MYKALYVGSKWCDSYPAHGLSNTRHNVVGSMNMSGMAECKHFAFDEFYFKHKKAGDEALIKQCESNKPDFIIMDGLNKTMEKSESGMLDVGDAKFDPKEHDWLNPTSKTLDVLSHRLNIPIVSIWWDFVWVNAIKAAEALLPYVKFNIITDSVIALYLVSDPNRYISMWTPQDPKLYYDEGEEVRDIPISYIGWIHKKKGLKRAEKIEWLRENGVDIFHAGGQREKTGVSIKEYASLIRRSKISLNLPVSHSSVSQLNGRTMEITLSGSMLFEELNQETLRLFIPMEDYVCYYGHADMLIKALHYMNHENERIEIAQSGCRKATKYYNNKQFWGIVLDKLEKENVL